MTKIVVDAFAWIEYFKESSLGRRFAEFIEDAQNELLCSTLTISEVSSKAVRLGRSPTEVYESILSLSTVFGINAEEALEIGRLHGKLKLAMPDFPMGDAAILHLARAKDAKILTGDKKHFQGFKETILIH